MSCTINNRDIDDANEKIYYRKLIDKIYKILPLYEECVANNILENFSKYIDVVLAEITGYYHYTNNVNFIVLSCIITSLKHTEVLTHAKVKALTFHCISIVENPEKLKKMR